MKFDSRKLSVFAQKGRNTIFSNHVGAFALDMVLHKFREFHVQKGEQLRQQFDDSNFNTRQLQGFARFDADEASTDDNGFFDFAFIADLAQKICIFHGLQRRDARQVSAGYGRHAWDRARGDNEFVISHRAGFTRGQFFESDGMIFCVDACYFRVHFSVNILCV